MIGENVIPEFHQEECSAPHLAPALRDIIENTPQRRRQLDAFARLDGIMATDRPPSEAAADIVIEVLGEKA